MRFVSQAKIEAQVQDREIHRLRQAAPSATDAIGQPKLYDIDVASSSSGLGVSSGDSAPQPTSPVSDPRVDQLIEVVQQLASRLEQRHGTDQGGVPSEEEELSERKIVDNRALLHLKLDPVPDNAAAFRTWRNALLVQIAKLDQSRQHLVHTWLSDAFQLDREEESGLLPRLDSFIAGEMTSLRVLKQVPDLGQEITAYVERCGQQGIAPKGRYMLALLTRFFDLDRVRGSVLTASTLFQVEISGNSMKDLKDFVQRVRIVLSQIPIGQRPNDRLTGEWLFHRVKHIRKLERTIEDIRESARDSRRREWTFPWDKIQDILIQDREDSNAQSVVRSLQSATPSKARDAPAETQPGKGKASAAAKSSPDPKATPPPPPPKAEAPGAPAPTPKPKPKPKAKAKAMTDAEKAKTPCVFFRMPTGCIHGENCKYSHEVEKAKAPPPPKPKPKAKETPKAKASPMAKAVVALVAASSLCAPAASTWSSFSVEWAADTAAGRHLGSASALSNQGIPKDACSSFLTRSSEPVTFHTGGGPQPGVHTLGFLADNMSFANHFP